MKVGKIYRLKKGRYLANHSPHKIDSFNTVIMEYQVVKIVFIDENIVCFENSYFDSFNNIIYNHNDEWTLDIETFKFMFEEVIEI